MDQSKKKLSKRNMNIIYGSIILISLILIVTLISLFTVSKIKNDKLQKEYLEATEKYHEVEEDSSLLQDPNYLEARNKDLTDANGTTIYIKHI